MDSTLTPVQEQVLALISAGSAFTAAAQTAGVHCNTVHNWLRSAPEFRLALAAAREAKALYWQEQAEQLAATAIDAIRQLLTREHTPAGVRLKAAQAILNLAIDPVRATALPAPVEESVHNPAQPAALPVPEPVAKPVHNSAQPIRHTDPKTGRNELCPCGSGKKFKRCCLEKAPIAA
jgi:hypothetical protein